MKDEEWGIEFGFACTDCRHYWPVQEGDNAHGQCRRFPPNIWMPEVGEAIWPSVASHQFCGEFELEYERRISWQAEMLTRITGPVPRKGGK